MDITLTCCKCGKSFVEHNVKVMHGVTGFIFHNGGYTWYIDPDEPRICSDCSKKRCEEILKKLKGV